MADGRGIWFTDRWGIEFDDDTTIERFGALLDELADGDDPEHACVDITDVGGWNLEFTTDRAWFENVEDGGEQVGQLRIDGREDALAIAADFLSGDFAALRARPWISAVA